MSEQQTSEADLDRQIIDLGHAIALSPKHANTYRDRALLYVRKRDFTRALIDLDQAILLNPEDAIAYYYRGYIQGLRKENTKATFNVDGVNVDEGEDFNRPGWTAGSFPAYGHEGKPVLVNGWTRGPFGIFARQFDDFDAGRTSAVPLVHLRSGQRVAVFADLEGAAIAAERAEPLADWHKMIAKSTSQDDIDERIYKTLRAHEKMLARIVELTASRFEMCGRDLGRFV